MTHRQCMHELRKAHKGNRRLARRIKKLEQDLKASDYQRYQFYMAMTYMAGFVKIRPYEGWIPETQYWIDMFEKRYPSTD